MQFKKAIYLTEAKEMSCSESLLNDFTLFLSGKTDQLTVFRTMADAGSVKFI